jgi:hypothetical protein
MTIEALVSGQPNIRKDGALQGGAETARKTTVETEKMSKDNPTKLLPCPFCGDSNAVICATNFEPEGRPAYAVSCRTRHCHGVIFKLGYGLFETHKETIAAWNTRAG